MRDIKELLGLHGTSQIAFNLKALADSFSKPKPVYTMDGMDLTIIYFDDNGGDGAGRQLLEENWPVDLVSGALTGNSIINLTNTAAKPPELQLSLFGNELTDAIH